MEEGPAENRREWKHCHSNVNELVRHTCECAEVDGSNVGRASHITMALQGKVSQGSV